MKTFILTEFYTSIKKRIILLEESVTIEKCSKISQKFGIRSINRIKEMIKR
jgi:hypothetical protein